MYKYGTFIKNVDNDGCDFFTLVNVHLRELLYAAEEDRDDPGKYYSEGGGHYWDFEPPSGGGTSGLEKILSPL